MSMLTGQSARRRGRRPAAAAAFAAAAFAALALPAAPAGAEETPTPSPAVDSSATPERKDTSFVLGIKQDIDSLNPYVGVVASAYEAYQIMYDYLTIESDKDFSPTPMLAESWENSPDGKTWTFHIRTGVKWSDGKDLTANDVVYTFKRAMEGETENGQYGNYVTLVTKVEATDDHTVVFTTSEASPSMLRMKVPILPEHIWKDIDAKEVATFANDTNVVGSGAFALTEVRAGQFYRFAANKNYWAGAPKIDELVIRIFADDEALVQALKAGEIDMVQDISAAHFESLQNVEGITTSDSKYSGFNELGFNTGAATTENKPIGDGHPALKDKQVRLAIDHAINRTELLGKVLRNHGSVATGVIPPIYPDVHWGPGEEERKYDPARANEILDAAGYARGADGIRAKDGKKLTFRLFGRESSEFSKKNVEYIRDWLREVGIQANVSIMSEDQLTAVIGEGKYDMFEWGWVVEPDPDFQLSVFTCDQRSYEEDGEIAAGWSDSFYCNPAYDALYAQQKTILDPAARAEVVKQAQKMLYDDAVYSMEYYYNNFEAYRSDRFTGFKPQPSDGGSLVFQYGVHSYLNLEPVDESKAGSDSDSGSLGWILGIAAGVIVLAGAAAALVFTRRRATADERE
jgi:peptide/nickel transport system substrate-binding protein